MASCGYCSGQCSLTVLLSRQVGEGTNNPVMGFETWASAVFILKVLCELVFCFLF